MKKFAAVLCTVVLMAVVIACGNTKPEEITVPTASHPASASSENKEKGTLEKAKEQGYITVAFANENPSAYETPDGKLTGQGVEVARAIFKKMGIPEMRGVLTEWASLIPGLKAGRYDVITAAMYITPERCKEIRFSEPDYSVGEALVVKKGNPNNLHSFEDIAANPDMKISIMSGSVVVDYMKKLGVKESQMVLVPDVPSSLAALTAKRVDATTASGISIPQVLKTAGTDDVERVMDFKQPVIDGKDMRAYGSTAFRMEDEAFLEEYNKVLKEMKDSGELFKSNAQFGFTEAEMPGDMTTAELCNR
jgi:polar amino acid transport system substrate-binding protein